LCNQQRVDCVEIQLVLFFYGQVEVTTRSQRAMEVGEYHRPVLGCDVLHRVDGHHRVEPSDELHLLQSNVPQLGGDTPRSRLGEHASRLVDADNLAAAFGHDREIPACAAWGVQDDATEWTRGQQPPDPLLVDLVRIWIFVVRRRPRVVIGDDSRPPLTDPRSSIHPGLPIAAGARPPHPETCDCHARCPPPQQIRQRQAPRATTSDRLTAPDIAGLGSPAGVGVGTNGPTIDPWPRTVAMD
jgi:hypothetical protein